MINLIGDSTIHGANSLCQHANELKEAMNEM